MNFRVKTNKIKSTLGITKYKKVLEILKIVTMKVVE